MAAISSITGTSCSIFAIDSTDLRVVASSVAVVVVAVFIVGPCRCIAKQTFAMRNQFLGYFACCFTAITALRVHY